jgi:predicted RNase H-like nuclease (RuvC/YqgF family)
MMKKKKKIIELEAKIENLEASQKALNDKIGDLQKRNDELQVKLSKASNLVREQTEADILLNALKAVGIIREEKKCNYIANHNALLSQAQGFGGAFPQGNRHDSFLRSLGGMFG